MGKRRPETLDLDYAAHGSVAPTSETRELARAGEPAPRFSFALNLVILTVFLPEGMSFFVAGLRLTFTRMLFLVITPLVSVKLGLRLNAGTYRFCLSDGLVPLTAFWMFLGPAVTSGIEESLLHSGPIVLEYLLAYLATRLLLSGPGSAVSFVARLCIVIALVSLSGIADTLSGRYLIRETVNGLTGYSNSVTIDGDQFRFGLLRASGPVEHAILFGFTSTLGLLLSVTVRFRMRLFCIAACTIGLVLSFSSAPLQCALLGLGLLAYQHWFRRVRHRWLLLSILPITFAISLFFVTNAPFGHLIELLTFDPATAYYRLYIWNEVGPVVLDNAWFGVVAAEMDYRGSVDSVWLVLSLLYGMPCAVLTGLSMIAACSLPADAARSGLSPEEARLGSTLGIIIFLIIFTGFTVHYWGSTWILIGLLVGVRAHLGELGQLLAERPGLR